MVVAAAPPRLRQPARPGAAPGGRQGAPAGARRHGPVSPRVGGAGHRGPGRRRQAAVGDARAHRRLRSTAPPSRSTAATRTASSSRSPGWCRACTGASGRTTAWSGRWTSTSSSSAGAGRSPEPDRPGRRARSASGRDLRRPPRPRAGPGRGPGSAPVAIVATSVRGEAPVPASRTDGLRPGRPRRRSAARVRRPPGAALPARSTSDRLITSVPSMMPPSWSCSRGASMSPRRWPVAAISRRLVATMRPSYRPATTTSWAVTSAVTVEPSPMRTHDSDTMAPLNEPSTSTPCADRRVPSRWSPSAITVASPLAARDAHGVGPGGHRRGGPGARRTPGGHRDEVARAAGVRLAGRRGRRWGSAAPPWGDRVGG